MGWTEQLATAFAAGKPARGTQVFQIFENVKALALGSDPLSPKIQNAALDNSIIKQANINTSTGEISTNSAGTFVLPGGSYGFYPQFKAAVSLGSSAIAQMSKDHVTPLSYTTLMHLESLTTIAYAQQRYINSSPPYNIGDGDIPLFFFGLLRGGGMAATYSADVPPWAYNGPTSVKAEAVGLNGKKYKINRKTNKDNGKVEKTYEEITHTVKNADMGIIPHPFGELEKGDEIILLNPPDTLDLLEMHEAGESIAGLFDDDYLRLDNSPIVRAMPDGVKACRYKWKNTK